MFSAQNLGGLDWVTGFGCPYSDIFPWSWGLSLVLSQGTCALFAQLKFMKLGEYLEKRKFSAEQKVTSKLQLVLGSCQAAHPNFKQTPSQDQLPVRPTENHPFLAYLLPTGASTVSLGPQELWSFHS